QAEDGIRDPLVTGVQTCALPISFDSNFHDGCFLRCERCCRSPLRALQIAESCKHGEMTRVRWKLFLQIELLTWHQLEFLAFDQRSEERRVGKECRLGL